jgi:regulator of protease activity HflC (stomatin/prohibitin superfamily)
MINRSEGEKQKRINEAQGKAEEIVSIGVATAESIKMIGQAIESPGGEEAIKLELSSKYFQSLSKLSLSKNSVIMSGNITNLDAMLKDLNLN